MVNFQDLIFKLESLGFADVLLPFILIFTVIFAILQKTEVLGRGKKNFNVAISFVISLGVIIPHVLGTYPPNSDAVEIINQALPNISVVLIAVLMVMLILGIFGKKWPEHSKISSGVLILAILIVAYIFGLAADWWAYLPSWLYWIDNPDTQALLILILVFGIIVSYITKEDDSSGGLGKSLGSAFEKIGDSMTK